MATLNPSVAWSHGGHETIRVDQPGPELALVVNESGFGSHLTVYWTTAQARSLAQRISALLTTVEGGES